MEAEKGNGANSNNSNGGNEPVQSGTMKFTVTATKSKFSASRPPKFPKVKQRGDDAETRDGELVTGFDEQGIVAKNPKGLRGARVIPKLENSWRPEKRMKNIVMETDVMTFTSTEDRFEKHEHVREGPTPGVKYGLTLGNKKISSDGKHVVTDEIAQKVESIGDQTIEEVVIERTTAPLTQAQREEIELRRDLVTLPEQADLDAYEEMPIEEFGMSLLRGMGWEEGKAIGRNCKTAVQPVEFVRRVDRTGLGAEPAPRNAMDQNKRPIKPGQSRIPAADLVAASGQDGRVRNVVPVGEKLVERTRKGVVNGKVMSIISGRHVGLRGEILDSGNPDRVSMKLTRSGEKIVVNAKDLADIGSLEEERVVKQIRELEISTGGASRRGHGREASNALNADEEERRVGGKEGRRDAKRDNESRVDGKGEKYGSREEEKGRSKRNDHEHQNNADLREDRRERRREDHERDRSRNDDRKAYSGQAGHDRREEARNVDSKRGGRKEDVWMRREQGRRLQKREERSAETDRRLGGGDDKKTQESFDRVKGGSLANDSNGGTGRYKDSWLTSQIRVRIVSKTLRGGRLYLKKASIVDVVTPTVCDLLLDESGEILQHVKQDHLETALPKRGGCVMVVGGKHRGHLGKLIERDSDGEVGLVQMEETFEMVNLNLDLLAEYVGDVSERH